MANTTAPSNSTCHTYNKPYFIVWYNHSYMALVLPPILLYLAFAAPGDDAEAADPAAVYEEDDEPLLSAPHRVLSTESTSSFAAPKPTTLSDLAGPCPPPGWKRVNWHLARHDVTWRRLLFTGVWAGFLFLVTNYAWFVGLGFKGMLPSEASAAANSSFAWVYIISLCLLHESFDAVKALAVLTCLAGVVLLALSGEKEDIKGNGGNSKGGKVEFSPGILVEVFCAFTQAFYYVAFRKWALRNGNMPPSIVAIITGLEGVAHARGGGMFKRARAATGAARALRVRSTALTLCGMREGTSCSKTKFWALP